MKIAERGLRGSEPEASAHFTRRGGFPTASLNISREVTLEDNSFNEMLRLSIVKERKLPRLITLVIMPPKLCYWSHFVFGTPS